MNIMRKRVLPTWMLGKGSSTPFKENASRNMKIFPWIFGSPSDAARPVFPPQSYLAIVRRAIDIPPCLVSMRIDGFSKVGAVFLTGLRTCEVVSLLVGEGSPPGSIAVHSVGVGVLIVRWHLHMSVGHSIQEHSAPHSIWLLRKTTVPHPIPIIASITNHLRVRHHGIE